MHRGPVAVQQPHWQAGVSQLWVLGAGKNKPTIQAGPPHEEIYRMQIITELKGDELYFTALEMLKGEEGLDWCHYQADAEWWALRLYTRRN